MDPTMPRDTSGSYNFDYGGGNDLGSDMDSRHSEPSAASACSDFSSPHDDKVPQVAAVGEGTGTKEASAFDRMNNNEKQTRDSPSAAAAAMTLRHASVDDLIDSLCGKSDSEIRLQLSKLEKRLSEVKQYSGLLEVNQKTSQRMQAIQALQGLADVPQWAPSWSQTVRLDATPTMTTLGLGDRISDEIEREKQKETAREKEKANLKDEERIRGLEAKRREGDAKRSAEQKMAARTPRDQAKAMYVDPQTASKKLSGMVSAYLTTYSIQSA
eukprot:CAMPEP_0179485838 /NCGR_PEP_ID=MMETSP0799-20121207/62318_1 /TAXON_ID=46947 /ORGANISM="Geminigera cryophila, Strain CCMP2564" /LENGTH=269 /DNA_ID=CAMNT_0021300349 /DNA_START=32 /DNA_END=839 /DNA_ORIENTATION=+